MLAINTETRLHDVQMGFLGAGSIVEAILDGIIKKELLPKEQIYVTNRSDKQRLQQLTADYGIVTTPEAQSVIANSNLLLLAMKPKDAAEACMGLRGLVREDQLVISLIAGVKTELINEWLGVECPIVRTMPNTSSAVGHSVTGIAKGRFASDWHLQLAIRLFEAIGTVHAVPETDLDIITGLSGSGPAYIYYLVEAMEQAGLEAGLTAEMARKLTVQTLLGAAQMLMHTEEEPAVLRRKVTSPGGTTEAGLEVLQSYEFQRAVYSAILRAAQRARELGEQYR